MVYTERDAMVRQEQCRDWLREARGPIPERDAGSRPSGSIARTLLALPVILISANARLLGTFMHLAHHQR
jgi:hypothetical protein